MARARAIRTRRVYVRRARSHRRASTIPLAAVAGFGPLAFNFIGDAKNLGLETAGRNIVQNLTGYNMADGVWSTSYLKNGAFPILAGFAVHMIASKLGINRALGRARVPWLRV